MIIGCRGRSPWPIAVVLLLLAATASQAHAGPRRRVVDGIVAIVDGACITRSELARFTARHEATLDRELAGRPAERIVAMEQLRKEALGSLVDRHLFAAEAQRRRVDVTEAEVDSGLSAVAAQNRLTVPELLVAAKEQGLDAATYRAEVRAQILEGKLLRMDVERRYPDWSKLASDEQMARIAAARGALLGELRERSFVEVRL